MSSIRRFENFDKTNEAASPKPGAPAPSPVDDFKEAVTKLFMEYDKSDFKHPETKEILDWLQDSTTIKFFEKLLKDK